MSLVEAINQQVIIVRTVGGDNQRRQMIGYRWVCWRRVHGINSWMSLDVSEKETCIAERGTVPAICLEMKSASELNARV